MAITRFLVCVATLSLACPSMSAQEPRDIKKEVYQLLQSEDRKNRLLAADRLLNERRKLVNNLIKSLSATDGSIFNMKDSTEGLCIRLLGELRAVEAVPLLIPRQLPLNAKVFSLPPGTNLARVSLVAIGLPAVDALIKAISEKGDVEAAEQKLGKECATTLVCIIGREAALQRLQKAMKQKPVSSLAYRNLKSAIDTIETRNSRQWEKIALYYRSQRMRTQAELANAPIIMEMPGRAEGPQQPAPSVAALRKMGIEGRREMLVKLQGMALSPAHRRFLLELIQDPDADLRKRQLAVAAFGRRREVSDAFVDTLQEMLAAPEKRTKLDPGLLDFVLLYFGQSFSKNVERQSVVYDTLVKLAKSKEANISDKAFIQLAYLARSDQALNSDALAELIGDRILTSDYRTRLIALEATRSTKSKGQLGNIRELLAEDSKADIGVKRAAVHVLAGLGEPQDKDLLMRLKRHGNKALSRDAETALKRLLDRLKEPRKGEQE